MSPGLKLVPNASLSRRAHLSKEDRVKQWANSIKNRANERFWRRGVFNSLNVSHSREGIARVVALPLAKSFWGSDLTGMLLVGSSQLKARMASDWRAGSDLDVVFIVRGPGLNPVRHLGRTFKILDFRGLLDKSIKERFSFHTHVWVLSEGHFKRTQPGVKEPFQIIYGKKRLRSLFSVKQWEGMQKIRELKKKKYQFIKS